MATILGQNFFAAIVAMIWATLLFGCDPRDSLENRDYLPYLDAYQRWDITDAVATFNALDTKRSDFNCERELEAAQRSVRREEGGSINAARTEPVKAFRVCLERYSKAAGADQTKIQAVVLSDWVNHNYLPDIQKRLDAEVEAIQKRVDGLGCGGEACKGLTIVGDLVMPRLAPKNAVPFDDALEACKTSDAGGLRPWRLPTKAELATVLASELLPSEAVKVAYWSSERVFDDSGDVLVSGFRFARPEGGEVSAQPESLPLKHGGLPAKAKVRCVFDLAKSDVTPTAVDVMEQSLVKAGCSSSDWIKHLRVREGLIVTWQTLPKNGPEPEEACEQINWCKATWAPPSEEQAEKLAADPWIGETASRRCVAPLPEG